jgi:hypothetical protein
MNFITSSSIFLIAFSIGKFFLENCIGYAMYAHQLEDKTYFIHQSSIVKINLKGSHSNFIKI